MSLGFCFPDPGTFDARSCQVCGTPMDVRRNVFGPTCFAEAKARTGRWHDRFECPHRHAEWREQAEALQTAADDHPSSVVAQILNHEAASVIQDQQATKSFWDF